MMWKKQSAASRRGVTLGASIVLLGIIATLGDLWFLQTQVRRKATILDSSYKGQVKVEVESDIKVSLPESLGKVEVESDTQFMVACLRQATILLVNLTFFAMQQQNHCIALRQAS